jgi:branched-chain amino acid transport system ATP-binding protein
MLDILGLEFIRRSVQVRLKSIQIIVKEANILTIRQIEVYYHNVIHVLKGVSITLNEGQIVSLLGSNGAGKTSTLKAISGLLRAEAGEVTEGDIWLGKERIDQKMAHQIAKLGIIQVMEGRRIFQHLTAEENLRVGYVGKTGEKEIQQLLQMVYNLFPRLVDLKHHVSGFLSGGEQQMMVIGRALLSQPKILLLDEPSLGLAPLLTQSIFRAIKQINEENKTAILLVEQNALAALEIAQYCYVMENGRIVMDGTSEKMKKNEDIKEFYLGLSEVGTHKSYREVKHYKRRKRWLA